MFPIAAQEQADAILGGGKFAPGYERTYWPGVAHGFAVRGDLVGAIFAVDIAAAVSSRQFCLS